MRRPVRGRCDYITPVCKGHLPVRLRDAAPGRVRGKRVPCGKAFNPKKEGSGTGIESVRKAVLPGRIEKNSGLDVPFRKPGRTAIVRTWRAI